MAEQSAPESPVGHGEDHEDEGYAGPALVVFDDGEEVTVEVRLECRHEPFDGRVHWSGRAAVAQRLTERLGNGTAAVLLRTGTHAAPGTLAEPDMWGRYRITGVGHPPFSMDAPPEPESD